jgi:hypothetical protein
MKQIRNYSKIFWTNLDWGTWCRRRGDRSVGRQRRRNTERHGEEPDREVDCRTDGLDRRTESVHSHAVRPHSVQSDHIEYLVVLYDSMLPSVGTLILPS